MTSRVAVGQFVAGNVISDTINVIVTCTRQCGFQVSHALKARGAAVCGGLARRLQRTDATSAAVAGIGASLAMGDEGGYGDGDKGEAPD